MDFSAYNTVSKQLATVTDPDNYGLLNPRDLEGRVRVAFFEQSEEEDGGEIAVTLLPAGARVIGGSLKHGAVSGTDLNEIDVKVVEEDGTETSILASGDITSAGVAPLASTSGYGMILGKKGVVVIDTNSNTIPAETLSGHVLYVVD